MNHVAFYYYYYLFGEGTGAAPKETFKDGSFSYSFSYEVTFLCYRWLLVYKPAQTLRHHNIGCQMALNTKKQMKINYRKWHLFQMFRLTFFFPL